MNIAIGNDHAGTSFKLQIQDFLMDHGYSVQNFGTDQDDRVDYPDMVRPVASAVLEGSADFGILLCGSANGVAITANKYKGLRAALCWTQEIAALTRQHNNANILCIPARFVDDQEAIAMVQVFLNTAFEGGRHQQRVDKIDLK